MNKYTYGPIITDSTGTYYLPNDVQIEFVCEELGHKDNPKKERKAGMETLYQVIVVSKDRDILSESKIVAEDQDEAKLGVDIHSVLRGRHLKLKDVTILCIALGDVKVRKEVQKVKVVDKDEV